ncbi:MAG: GTP-binding protein [Myxococcales bacterium]
MSVLNHSAREICAKVVYYGPGLSGKTTSLKRVYESVKPTHRGEMISLATEGDRTLFFDFLPVRVEKVGDCQLRLALYTVPGQVFYNSTRKLVLQGADGVVFVADSQAPAMDSNLESMENLKENLEEMGCAFESFPLVIQYNKRDIPGVLPISELRAQLNPRGVPDFETIAARGGGVLDSLRAVTRGVIRSLKEKGVVLTRPRPPAKSHAVSEPSSGPTLGSQLEELTARASSDPSLISALVPERLSGEAALAEADYRAGNYKQATVRAMNALRSLMVDLGQESLSEVDRAVLAGLWGPDFARLLRINAQPAPAREDAAFAMLMLAMAGVRQRR